MPLPIILDHLPRCLYGSSDASAIFLLLLPSESAQPHHLPVQLSTHPNGEVRFIPSPHTSFHLIQDISIISISHLHHTGPPRQFQSQDSLRNIQSRLPHPPLFQLKFPCPLATPLGCLVLTQPMSSHLLNISRILNS